MRGFLELDSRRLDSHLLRDGARLKNQPERYRLVHPQLDVFLNVLLEALELGRDKVNPRAEQRCREPADLVGLQLPHLLTGLRVGDRDTGSRNHGPGLVQDGAGDLPCRCLSDGSRRQEGDDCRER